MTILERMNLRPLPVFEADGKAAGDGAKQGDGQGDAGAKEADKGGSGSFMDDGDAGGDKGGDAKPGLPENWRDFFADEADPEIRRELDRVKTPKDMGKRLRDLTKKVVKGVTDEEPPDGAKEPEKLKAWREERGIPTEPTGYTIPDEIKTKLSEADKPLIDGFIEFMHKDNATPKEVQRALKYYTGLQDAVAADQAAADKVASDEVRDAMRAEWGPDFKRNFNIMKRAAENFGGVNWTTARLPDGRLLGNIPEVAAAMFAYGERTLSDMDLEDAGGGNPGGGTDAEIATLEAQMKNIKEWRRNPKGQARLMELYAKRDARAARG